MSTYPAFPKIPRLHRDVIITEKIDGTNGLVSVERSPVANIPEGMAPCRIGMFTYVHHEGETWEVRAGSRTRWLMPGADNYDFAQWVENHAWELVKLGPGLHYGEWFGKGIQRGYGLDERRFALFNTGRWNAENTPDCVTVVPVLDITTGDFLNRNVERALHKLRTDGSLAVPGFKNPEGVVVFHTASRHTYKVLLENDNKPKGNAA